MRPFLAVAMPVSRIFMLLTNYADMAVPCRSMNQSRDSESPCNDIAVYFSLGIMMHVFKYLH